MTGGRKDDQEKLPYHLLPPELMEGIAAVLQFGARKYAPRNWELGMSWSRPFSALMRHMWAWWRGEKADPETGMSHLWHAGCCLTFLIAYEQRQTGTDDRPTSCTASGDGPTHHPAANSPATLVPSPVSSVWPLTPEEEEESAALRRG